MERLFLKVSIKNTTVDDQVDFDGTIQSHQPSLWGLTLYSPTTTFRVVAKDNIEAIRLLKCIINQPLTKWAQQELVENIQFTVDEIYSYFPDTVSYMAIVSLALIANDMYLLVHNKNRSNSFEADFVSLIYDQIYEDNDGNQIYLISKNILVHKKELNDLFEMGYLGKLRMQHDDNNSFYGYFIPFHIPLKRTDSITPKVRSVWEKIKEMKEKCLF